VTSGLVTASLCLGKPRSVFALPDSPAPGFDGPLISLMKLTAELPCSERLGHACLRVLENREISSSNLAQLIIAELDLKAIDYSVPRIRKGLRQRIGMDFEQMKIVDVDGWCLSLTETRLYAIAFLHGTADLEAKACGG